jgi:phosphatidylglycerol---prolipoprotein diacylglyceryl transferase
VFPRLSDIFNYYIGSSFQWPVYTYNFFLVSAFTGAFVIVHFELGRKSRTGEIQPESEQHTLYYIVLVLISAFIGLKLFHYLDYPDQFLKDPLKAIFTLNGLSFYGGLIFGTLAVIIYSLIIKVRLPHAGDIAAPAICLGYAIGRMGCHLSGDGCWGIENPGPGPEWMSFLPGYLWSCNYPHNVANAGIPLTGCQADHCNVLPVPVYPTSLYESIFSLLLFIFIWSLRKRKWTPGYMFAIYLLLEGFARFFIEMIRINPKYNVAGLMLSQAQIISAGIILLGFFLLWLFYKVEIFNKLVAK